MIGFWFLVFGSRGRAYVGRVAMVAAVLLLAVVSSVADGAGVHTAQAQSSVAKVRLLVADSVDSVDSDDSKSGDSGYERARLEEITKVAAKRVRDRLQAAQIKQFSVETRDDDPGAVLVTAYGGVSHALLAGIVAPQGRFELRPAEPVGRLWMKRSSNLPEGVEVRQEKGRLSAGRAFLWSKSRSTLAKAVAEVEFQGMQIELFPHDGGWRTLALGKPVATHSDVAKARIRHGKTGDVYVRLRFSRDVSADHLPESSRRTWAVVLDGEVVAAFQRLDSSFGRALSLTAPDHLATEKRRRIWAQQVAGRLAAYMSVPLVEVADN